jgi:peptidoglycan hydrolase-like amidase
LVLTTSVASAQNVRIGVLGLFRPHELTIRPSDNSALLVHADQQMLVLEARAGIDAARFRLAGDTIVVETGSRSVRVHSVHVSTRQDGPAEFILSVPGKISRRYHGTLELIPQTESLLAVVDMDLETAVASVVAAESAPYTPLEALKAQAVAARSYLVAARARHHDFDFCDTTHCQFLRNPPPPGTPVAQAVAETRGMMLAYESQPVATMYTRSCSGRTRTPAEIGLPAGNYPYYSVDCKYCREHPVRWERQVSVQETTGLRAADEWERLAIDRHLGWNTVPSDTFSMKRTGAHVILEGRGQGHGIGLCQAGAAAMAREGAKFSQILVHYYPNTTIVSTARLATSAR